MTSLPLAEIVAYIRARLPEAPAPGEVAAHLGINRLMLSRRFRTETGLSLREYIAALKIEHSIAPLVAGDSIIDSQLEAGHASAATYSHSFRQHTGLTPRDYRAQAQPLSDTFNHQLAQPSAPVLMHHSYDPATHPQAHALTVEITGASPRSVVFAGLFPKPIPRGAPIVGGALFASRTLMLDNVPDGTYHLLACELAPSLNPLHYFRVDHCLRALYPQPITFPLPEPQTLTLPLRPFEPSDPPITVNMPKLLFDVLRRMRNS